MASFIALRHFNFLSLITSKLCSPLTNLTSCKFNSSFFAFEVKVFNVKVRFSGLGWSIGKVMGGGVENWGFWRRRKNMACISKEENRFFSLYAPFLLFFFSHFSNSLSLVFSRIFQRTLSRQVEIVGEFLPYSKDLCSMNCPFFYHVQRKTSIG